MSPDIHDQVTHYVLDELGESESAAFEAHLETCAECRLVVEGLRQVAADLAFEYAEPPPGHLRAEVLAAVMRTPQEASPLAPVTPIRRRRRLVPVGIAAAIVLLALVGWSMLGTGRLINAVLNDPSSVTIEAVAGAGQFDAARVVFSRTREAAVLVVEGLDQLPADRTYELWLVDGEEVLPAGLFNTGEAGSASVLVDGEVLPGMVVAVTEEAAGGVEAPTGEILLSAPVDA